MFITGARVSMQRCQLQTPELPEDETCCHAHQSLQAENERWLPDLQTTHRPVLLPCETLPRNQMSGAVLLQHQTQTQTTTASTATATGTTVAATYGGDEHEDSRAEQQHVRWQQRANERRWRAALGSARSSQSCQFDEQRWDNERKHDGHPVATSAGNWVETRDTDAARECSAGGETGTGGGGETAGSTCWIWEGESRGWSAGTKHATSTDSTDLGTSGNWAR